jgi:hypothetical protein
MGRTLAWLPLLFLIGCASAAQQREQSRRSGLELLLRVDTSFALESGLCAGELNNGKPASPAHCWPAAVHLAALTSAAQIDPFWRPRLERFIAAMDAHWLNHAGVGAYDASANPQKADRYYDDNAWMALALLEAHWLTRDPEHLRRADDALAFVLNGEDQQLGGGIYWHEQSRRSKNSCSTGPAIVACLRLYQSTGNENYRVAAQRLYKWINSRLRDGDNLFFDRVDLAGRVERTKFSYNTAMMIVANCEWFDVTSDPRYLDDARKMASAGVRYWVDPQTGAIRDDAAFASLFAESLLQLYRRDGDPRCRDIALTSIRFVRDRNLDPNCWHPTKWNEQPRTIIASPRLIDQSAAARAMLQAEIVR